MKRDSLSYLILHYLLMIVVILSVVSVVDEFVLEVSLWIGIAIAVCIGLGYPIALNIAGIAPEQWS